MKILLFPSVLLTLLTVLGSGCFHTGLHSTQARKKEPVVKNSLILEPADQAQYYSGPRELRPDPTTTEAPPSNSADSVQTAQPVEAYPIQRYVDPTDPNVMHERHVVYRKAPAIWKLHAAPSQQVIVGPTVNSTQAQVPLYSQEVTSFLREQQLVNEGNRRAVQALLGATKDLQEDAIRRRTAEAQAKKAEAADAQARKAKTDADANAKQTQPEQQSEAQGDHRGQKQ